MNRLWDISKWKNLRLLEKVILRKSAQDYIDNHIDCTLSGVDKSFLYEGYVNGAIDILESLGTFIDSDDDEDINEKIKERKGYREDFRIINHKV